VANTDVAPVSCANVNILLSTDGGWTFPYTLASSVPNTGLHTIVVPGYPSTTCRIKVEGDGNIFFNISEENFTIEGLSIPAVPSVWILFTGILVSVTCILIRSGWTG